MTADPFRPDYTMADVAHDTGCLGSDDCPDGCTCECHAVEGRPARAGVRAEPEALREAAQRVSDKARVREHGSPTRPYWVIDDDTFSALRAALSAPVTAPVSEPDPFDGLTSVHDLDVLLVSRVPMLRDTLLAEAAEHRRRQVRAEWPASGEALRMAVNTAIGYIEATGGSADILAELEAALNV